MLKLLLSINMTLILKYKRYLVSKNSVAIKLIFFFSLVVMVPYWKLIIHYFLDVFYIPSCVHGSRNVNMAKLEDTRNVGIPVAHMGIDKNEYFYWLLSYKYIQADQFITLSPMKNKLCIQLNCHHNCVLLKLWDKLKNMANTCSRMVSMILLYCNQDVLLHSTISFHIYPLSHHLFLWLKIAFLPHQSACSRWYMCNV